MKKDLIKFDLKKLKGKKVVVNCKTKEQFQNFIKWVNNLGIDLDNYNLWDKHKEYTCLRLTSDLYWGYSIEPYYKELNYEIISYEEALLKKPKKQKKSKKIKSNKQKFPCFVSINNGGEIVSCPNEGWFLEVLKPKGFELATKDEVESYYYLGKD